jgi:hypothetical protein
MTRSYETQPTQSREYMNGFLLRAISGCIALEAALSAPLLLYSGFWEGFFLIGFHCNRYVCARLQLDLLAVLIFQ